MVGQAVGLFLGSGLSVPGLCPFFSKFLFFDKGKIWSILLTINDSSRFGCLFACFEQTFVIGT